MTDQPEYTLAGEPLSVCATNALLDRLRLEWTVGANDYRRAILAELETRRERPYGGLCVP